MPESIYLDPYSLTLNTYQKQLKSILNQLGYEVQPFSKFWRNALRFNARNQTVFFSWLEDSVAQPHYLKRWRRFLLALAKISLVKLTGNRLVWVRHNIRPHRLDMAQKSGPLFHGILVKLLYLTADVKLVHSETYSRENPEFKYIPHPAYPIVHQEYKPFSERRVRYLVFGRLMPYKGLDSLLQHWPKELPLMIRGSCDDELYLKAVVSIIESRHLDVDLEIGYISEPALNDLLLDTQCVMVANQDHSMIASGVIIHALSAGCKVVAFRHDFALELLAKELPVTVFERFEDVSEAVDASDLLQIDRKKKPVHFLEESVELFLERALAVKQAGVYAE